MVAGDFEDTAETVFGRSSFMLNGRRHGFEWWLNQDEQSVYQERYWSDDEAHGIEREWDAQEHCDLGSPNSTFAVAV
jgi:hypothetical protein